MYIKSHFGTLHSLSGQYFTEFLKKDTPNFACYLVNSIFYICIWEETEISTKNRQFGVESVSSVNCFSPYNGTVRMALALLSKI